MPLPPATPISRFGIIYLLAAVLAVFAMLWLLHHLPKPKPDGQPSATPQPSASIFRKN